MYSGVGGDCWWVCDAGLISFFLSIAKRKGYSGVGNWEKIVCKVGLPFYVLLAGIRLCCLFYQLPLRLLSAAYVTSLAGPGVEADGGRTSRLYESLLFNAEQFLRKGFQSCLVITTVLFLSRFLYALSCAWGQ